MSSNNYKVTFIRDAIHKNINISEPVIQALISCKFNGRISSLVII